MKIIFEPFCYEDVKCEQQWEIIRQCIVGWGHVVTSIGRVSSENKRNKRRARGGGGEGVGSYDWTTQCVITKRHYHVLQSKDRWMGWRAAISCWLDIIPTVSVGWCPWRWRAACPWFNCGPQQQQQQQVAFPSPSLYKSFSFNPDFKWSFSFRRFPLFLLSPSFAFCYFLPP